MLEVLSPGPLTTIQDLGRPGWAHLGISRSGAADRGALRLANRLVGNAEGAAALETTLAGPKVRAVHDAVVALTGAPCAARCEGTELAMHTPISLRAGQELAIGRARGGARTYLAVAGGIAVAPTLGSCATDTLGGLGPAPLAKGDRLAVGPRTGDLPAIDAMPIAGPEDDSNVWSGALEIALLLGPREDWFDPEQVAGLAARRFSVSSSSDRVGVRLDGEPLRWARGGELRSEGIVPGAVQVPPSGAPIVLLADHPTTGGYPVIGVVPEADLDRVAQLRPGGHLRLMPLVAADRPR